MVYYYSKSNVCEEKLRNRFFSSGKKCNFANERLSRVIMILWPLHVW